jgi:hypothetical protein
MSNKNMLFAIFGIAFCTVVFLKITSTSMIFFIFVYEIFDKLALAVVLIISAEIFYFEEILKKYKCTNKYKQSSWNKSIVIQFLFGLFIFCVASINSNLLLQEIAVFLILMALITGYFKLRIENYLFKE